MRKTSGFSLLLLIFLSLCLVTFSLLAASESAADRRLSEKSADRTTAYYEANTEANRRLAEIDEQLAAYLRQAQGSDRPEETYRTLCGQITEDLPEISWDTASNASSNHGRQADTASPSDARTEHSQAASASALAFFVPVTDTQLLLVCLSIPWPEDDSDPLYEISVWQIVNTGEWTPDTSQNLLRIHK